MLCKCLVSLNAGFMPSCSFDGYVLGNDDAILLFASSRVLIYIISLLEAAVQYTPLRCED